jgi:hypothetical protein
VLSYMCTKEQCFDFCIRGRRIIPTTDVKTEILSPSNCKYMIRLYIFEYVPFSVVFSGKFEFITTLLVCLRLQLLLCSYLNLFRPRFWKAMICLQQYAGTVLLSLKFVLNSCKNA